MEEKSKYHEILVTLDSLFDTRLALANQLDPHFDDTYLETTHRRRISDSFWLASNRFSKAQWVEAWQNRDVSLLKRSIKTNMYALLSATICSIDWGVAIKAKDRIVRLTINTYPYRLSAEDKEGLRSAIENYEFITLNVVVNWTHFSNYNPIAHPGIMRYHLFIHHSIPELMSSFINEKGECDLDQFTFTGKTFILPKLLTDYTAHEDINNYNDPADKERIDNLLNPPKGCEMELFTMVEVGNLVLAEMRITTVYDFSAYLPNDVTAWVNTIQEYTGNMA